MRGIKPANQYIGPKSPNAPVQQRNLLLPYYLREPFMEVTDPEAQQLNNFRDSVLIPIIAAESERVETLEEWRRYFFESQTMNKLKLLGNLNSTQRRALDNVAIKYMNMIEEKRKQHEARRLEQINAAENQTNLQASH